MGYSTGYFSEIVFKMVITQKHGLCPIVFKEPCTCTLVHVQLFIYIVCLSLGLMFMILQSWSWSLEMKLFVKMKTIDML